MKVLLYRIINEQDGCRYIELDMDGNIHLDIGGKPIVSNANCSVRIDNEEYADVETWVTEDVFNRLKNADGTDTFTDVADMIRHGEYEEFEEFIREDEINMIAVDYGIENEDAEDIVDTYALDYFDRSIILYVWESFGDIGEGYVDSTMSNDVQWMKPYMDFDELGRDMVSDRYSDYYELYDGRIIEYCY